MQNKTIIELTKNTISKHDMLGGVESVLCALSGGADSVVLLYVLKEILKQRDIRLRAVHVNHSIRGEEAKRDENFCRTICGNLGIELVVKVVDAPSFAKENGI